MEPIDLLLGILAVVVAWIVYQDLKKGRSHRPTDHRTGNEASTDLPGKGDDKPTD